MAKVALAMIIKDSEPMDMLARCLYSVAPHVDGMFFTLNGPTEAKTNEAMDKEVQIKELCEQRGYPTPVIDYIKWEKDFSKARNHNFEQVTKNFEYILWLDTDDILRGGDKLHQIAEEGLEKGFGSVFFNYLYKVDFDPQTFKIRSVLIEHLRERLIRNDGSYKWVAPIHETLIEQRETNKTDSGLCDVVHFSTDERAEKAMLRNVEILEAQLASQGNRRDPRTMYYLAKCYFDLRGDENWLKAERLITEYLHGSETNTPSGWAEERAQAWEYLGEIYRERGWTNKSIKATANAMIESPVFPNFYIDMGLAYLYAKDWKRAKFWALLAQHVPYPKTTLVLNPRDMQVRTLEILYQVAVNTNQLEDAWAAAVKIAEFFPNDKIFQERVEHLEMLRVHNRMAHEIVDLARYMSRKGQSDKVEALVKAIPQEIAEEPVMMSLRRDFTPPKVWGEDEVAIMCGKGFEKWSPKNLAKGIGGSEEAVIYLSRELSRLGWKVTVYGDPQEDAGVYEGVTYEPHYKLNPHDSFNILIAWRAVAFFDHPWKAKKMFLWNHDIQNPNEYTQARLDKMDRIFMLSEWHRQNVPAVPDYKFMITGNGINLTDLEALDKENIKRNPHRMIYTSSYDRGLEHLLKMWPDIKKEVKDAELHIFYGWNLFESFYYNNPERMAWKAKMDKLMEQDGITHHGRVGQGEVLAETFKSGIWAYPTHFGEISCITAMKCQAAGAIPVVCDYAALKETVQFGKKINVDEDDIYTPAIQKEYTKALVEALKDTKWQDGVRSKMVIWARGRFAWSAIARQWDREFKLNAVKEASEEILKEKPEAKDFLPYQIQKELGHEQTY